MSLVTRAPSPYGIEQCDQNQDLATRFDSQFSGGYLTCKPHGQGRALTDESNVPYWEKTANVKSGLVLVKASRAPSTPSMGLGSKPPQCTTLCATTEWKSDGHLVIK